jgi:hypothetical protein
MKSLHLIWLMALPLLGACAGAGSQREFLAGRQALLRGEPDNALAYFERVARDNPGFVFDGVSPRRSVWTYVGRARYNSSGYDAAGSAFEKALSHLADDHVARMYLGLTLLRPSAPQTPTKAFNLQEVTYALREGVEPKRVATLARERGVAFDLTRETEAQLRVAGADNFLVGELRNLRSENTKQAKGSEARRAQGSKELNAALVGLRSWWDDYVRYAPQGKFWDPTLELRKQLDLVMKQAAAQPADWSMVISNAEWLGYQLEEESDRARRDESIERDRLFRR